MSDGSHEDLPEVVVHKGRGVGLIWLIPVLAVVIGAFMGYRAWENQGVQIVITYPTADWLEAGKTKIKFRSVEIGTVDDIAIAKDTKLVELHCTLDKRAKHALTEGAEFWIEHPRVGGGQISGLGTLLSGAFIGMRGGKDGGKSMRRFAGLETPPVEPEGEGGLRVVLHSAELYSLSVGSYVFYLQQPVGKVEAYELADDGKGFVLHLFIREKYAHLVRHDSRFWNAGGLELSASLGKVDVKTPSLAALLSGGLAFDSPGGSKSAAAEGGASYWLHPSRFAVDTSAFRYGGLRVIVEAPHLGGAAVGDPVSYRELTVGEVISSELAADSRKLRLHLNIQSRYAPLVRHNSVFWNASGISADLGLTGLHIHAESLQALLSGGVAFATPDDPGHRVKAGSVFKLHPEIKDKWLKWSPKLLRGSAASTSKAKADAGDKEAAGGDENGEKEKKEGVIARFFHHGGKSAEDSAKAAEPSPDAAHHDAHHDRKHGHLRRR